MHYQQALQFLYERLPMFQRIGPAALKADLTNTIKLLNCVGNPHLSFKSVHIAGTNGKGSSAHSIASVLQEAGYKTGLYTSPHLKEFTERIKINGEEIDKDAVIRFVEKYQQDIIEISPSFFEVTVAMAFQYFAEQKVDIAIIETGLGGRLDSTNVINPIVSLITMIGKDHASILGDTLEKIAFEKAGIIKPEKPVVIGADQPELLPLFAKKAVELESALFTCRHLKVEALPQVNHFKLTGSEYEGEYEVGIFASYYLKNLPGIIKTLELVKDSGFGIEKEHVGRGLKNLVKNTGLKGRWQIISNNPLIVADISHNEPGIVELVKQINNIQFDQLHLIIGMVSDKDVKSVLKLLPTYANYYFTQSSVPRSLHVNDLQNEATQMNLVGIAYQNVNEALDAAKKNANPNDFILVCGSTFVVAEIEDL